MKILPILKQTSLDRLLPAIVSTRSKNNPQSAVALPSPRFLLSDSVPLHSPLQTSTRTDVEGKAFVSFTLNYFHIIYQFGDFVFMSRILTTPAARLLQAQPPPRHFPPRLLSDFALFSSLTLITHLNEN